MQVASLQNDALKHASHQFAGCVTNQKPNSSVTKFFVVLRDSSILLPLLLVGLAVGFLILGAQRAR